MVLLLASRVMAPAARSAVSAASRRAARAGSGGATSPDILLRGRPPIVSPPFGRCLASLRAAVSGSGSTAAQDLRLLRSPVATPPFVRCLFSHKAGPGAGVVEVVFDDKDLESDEAVWNLYERWCKAYEAERSREEMQRRFAYFKDSVRFTDREKKKAIRDGTECSYGLNMYADGKLWEQQANQIPSALFDRQPYSESLIYGRASPFISQRDDTEKDFPDPFA
ncbi:unnamed protein product [Urochloa humidicola]